MWASGVTAAVLAQGWRPQLVIAGAYLAGALLLGALIIALAGRWRRRAGNDILSPDDQLTHFRSLYERGAISAEEFNRLRETLIGTAPRRPAATAPDPGEIPPGEIQLDEPPKHSPAGDAPPDGSPEAPPSDGIRPA
jgi:hypothetical protein